MLNRFTIRQRMLAWNVTAIAFVVMVGGIGELAVGQLDGAMDAITGNGSAIRHQMQADQAHDALRADVLAALLAGDADTAARDAARREGKDEAERVRRIGLRGGRSGGDRRHEQREQDGEPGERRHTPAARQSA